MELSDIDMELVPDEVDKLHDELVQRVDTSKLILKFLEKKIALEEEYATQVRQLCKSQPSLGPSGTAGCFSVLVHMICDQASSTLGNLATLTHDAISPLKAAVAQLKGDVNETYAEGKRLQHERKKAFDNYKKAKYVYESIIQDSPQQDKTTAAENDYKCHITFVNKNQSSYFQDQLPSVIQQFQASEHLRVAKTHESILKFVHFMSDSLVKTNEILKASHEKLTKPVNSISHDVDKYRKFCEEHTQPPSDILFGAETRDTERRDFLSPNLRNILRHGKLASSKWRNSLSVLTSPHRETKKVKRQSVPLKTSVNQFGTPLHLMLEHQKKTYPQLDVPYIAYYLVKHFKKIGGMQTENIFRVPGMTVEVQNVKTTLEAGEFTDELLFCSVHSTASAFTMWLRELPSPLIPYYMHTQCLGFKTREELVRIFHSLPTAHCSMLVYLLTFIGELAKTENQVKTHMNDDNLAMVFTPSILRSQNSADVLMNIEKERQFVKSAIDAVDMLSQTFPVSLQVRNPDQSPIKI